MAEPNGDGKHVKHPLHNEEELIAVYVCDGDRRLVRARVNVLIINDGNRWFAHGIEADYSAEGSTIEDVQKRFETGMAETIKEYFKRDGEIFAFFRQAPEKYIKLYDEQKQKWYLTLKSKLDIASPGKREIQTVTVADHEAARREPVAETCPMAELDVEYVTAGSPA